VNEYHKGAGVPPPPPVIHAERAVPDEAVAYAAWRIMVATFDDGRLPGPDEWRVLAPGIRARWTAGARAAREEGR